MHIFPVYIHIYIYISGPLAQAFGRVSLGLPLHIYTVPSRPLYVDNGKLDRSSHEQTKFPAIKEFLIIPPFSSASSWASTGS